MDTFEHQLHCLAEKFDGVSERFFAHALKHQETLAELRNELTALSHGFGENFQDLQRLDHAVRGNGKDGLLDRVLKLELMQIRFEEQRKRHLGTLWTVVGALVVYVMSTLLGKVL